VGSSSKVTRTRRLSTCSTRSRAPPPGYAVAEVEAKWREEAEHARSLRRTAGVFLLVVGGLATGAATTLAFVAGPHEDKGYTTTGVFFGLGIS
jgi:hypothetical protein